MTELVIVADDLTGAADSAALMTRRGRTSIVLEAGGEWPADDVLAVDTDSRHREPAVAAAAVTDATRRAVSLGAQVVKKIDSTLRGNVAAELRAMSDVFAASGEHRLLVVAPAFPATGRTTVDGVVHVDGQRLSAHGSDGDVVGLLGRGGLRAGHLGRVALSGPDALAERLVQAHDRWEAVVVDSESDRDLETVVAASRRTSVPVLLAGSGGLTRPLAGPPRPSYDDAAGDRPVLVVVGSYASVSRAQRHRLVESGLTPVLLHDDDEANTSRTVDDLVRALAHGDAVLSPDPDAPVDRGQAARVAQLLADAATGVLDRVGTLVATGGETARAVLTTAGVSRLVVSGEVEPGVVRGRVPELDLDVVTKAGAFGDADALVRCLPHLQTIEEERTP
jgi:D-threonate/D-erythronate kinase